MNHAGHCLIGTPDRDGSLITGKPSEFPCTCGGSKGTHTLADQMAAWDRHHNRALVIAANTFTTYRNTVLGTARDRFENGFKVHGDLMFRWDADRLLAEALEEAADLINYLVAMLAKERDE